MASARWQWGRPVKRVNRPWSVEIKAEANKALRYHSGSHSVTVGCISSRSGERCQGTGVCLTLDGEFFVVTAAHMLEHLSTSTLYLVPKPKGDYVAAPAVPPSSARYSDGFEPTIATVLFPARHKSQEDVALLHLQGRPRELQDAYFYPVDLIAPPPLRPGIQVMLAGFPVETTHMARAGDKRIPISSPVFDAPRVVRVPLSSKLRLTKDYNPALHFVLEFPDLPGNPITHPRGMSGGGVWALDSVGAVWQPTLRLVGIQVAWHESLRLLTVTRIKRVWRILASWRENRADRK